MKNQNELVDSWEEAQFYILNSKYSKAIEILNKLLKKNKNNPELHYQLGLCYEALNMQDEAKREFRRAIELEPDSSEAKRHLDKLIGE